VSRSANDSDLRRAYKKLALQFHPDKNKTPGATDCFKAIGKAFAVLSDAKKRQDYDSFGPEIFDSSANLNRATRSPSFHSSTSNLHTKTNGGHKQNCHHSQGGSGNGSNNTRTNYWNDDEFSADELFNLFFGNYANGSNGQQQVNGARQRTRNQRNQTTTSRNGNFVFSSSVLTLKSNLKVTCKK
jgi:DnaJ-class molecular chaperone